jgi:hypothetical protein
VFRFREVPPPGNVITALQAAAAAHFHQPPGGYILGARFGLITAPSWRTPSAHVLNHRPVWLVVYADSPVPGTLCAGSGKRFGSGPSLQPCPSERVPPARPSRPFHGYPYSCSRHLP